MDEIIERFLAYHVFPASSLSFQQEEITEVRHKIMYTNEVNDILYKNLSDITVILRKYASSGNLTYDNLVQIFLFDSQPRLIKDKSTLHRAIIKAKMTVVKDFEAEAI